MRLASRLRSLLLPVAATLLISGLPYSATASVLGVVVVDGSTVIPENTPFSVPAGSVTHIFFYGPFAVAVVTTPNPNPPAGAKPQPDPTKPRIQLPPPPPVIPPLLPVPQPPIIQIPQPENVKSISQVLFDVIVVYNDGATATVPGSYLSPGTPNPVGSFLPAMITPGTAMGGLAPGDAQTLFTQLVDDPDLTAELGYPLTLSDFTYNFSGTTAFPVWTGPTTYAYADGTSAQADFNAVPEPATFGVAALCLASLFGALRWNKGKPSRSFSRLQDAPVAGLPYTVD